jgi:oligopeptide/dipeptide ABC transporter ATP-binding protein
MRQRALIAMSLACHPSLLIADEPTSALDVTVQAQILGLIKKLIADLGIGLLLISHDMGIIAGMTNRVYVMYAGRIVESADVTGLYEDPKHPYTKALFQSILTIDERKERIPTISGNVPDLINPPKLCRFFSRCAMAKRICSEREPPLVRLNSNREVFCWLYG